MVSGDQDELPTVPDGDRGVVSDWLRRELGRPLIVAVVVHVESDWDTSAFHVELGQTESVKYVVSQPDSSRSNTQFLSVCAKFANLAPDVVLAWCGVQPADAGWLRALVQASEQVGLAGECLMAVAGTELNRQLAHSLGFDTWFRADEPFDEIFRMLAREGVTREIFRRRGSSPPCYL